jgi:hypothetical protein
MARMVTGIAELLQKKIGGGQNVALLNLAGGRYG